MTQHTGRGTHPEAEQSPDTPTDDDGELVTAPWMGLHYLTEAP